ncbi:allantoate deiminase 2-like [Eucalyptus grandis]|uniref:allantoate deiminase 2-like n=1 Tax=Eucalyptus grandis TaxID=71139 RepID=UPI00192F0823|nr:allantoate deiminase 2-like [Eucalyptus grandis]
MEGFASRCGERNSWTDKIEGIMDVTVKGSQGHAGTVPMSMRQDPMSAAAKLIVLLESLCKRPEDFLSFNGHYKDTTVQSLSTSLVCTVGEISSWPSASNVIPGQVVFTVDVRAIDDMGREAVIYELSKYWSWSMDAFGGKATLFI